MAEEIHFNFRGQISDQHLMDFYEAGRFQYGAARLMVKLDQFRRGGRFSSRVTSENNTRILLQSQRDGSFDILALAPFLQPAVDAFVQAPISLMLSYVSDRLIKPTSPDNVTEALRTQRDLIEAFNNQIADHGEQNQRTLDMLQERLARGDQLTEENRSLYERLLSETERRAYLEGQADVVRRITPEQDAKLTAMAAPLLKDMGVALRRSASSLNIIANDNHREIRVVHINSRIANEIDTSEIDHETTLILVKIVQYNTETGWGKLRLADEAGLLSFNVPSDRKAGLQRHLLDAMNYRGNQMDTFVECLFVRTPQHIVQRAIILAIRDIEELEER